MRSARKAHETGFTLIELLVVVAIMMVLMGMLLGAVSLIREHQRKVLATKQVHDIASAADAYFIMMNQYPPDTGFAEMDGSTADFTADDPAQADAIYHYLGRKIYESASDTKFGTFLIINMQHLRNVGGQELMVDPWGVPYRMDCVHVKSSDGAAVVASQQDYVARDVDVARVGAPYAATVPLEKRTYPVKVWSVGRDKHEGTDPFSHVEAITDEWDRDNIGSWK